MTKRLKFFRNYLHDAALVQVCDDVDAKELTGIYELLRLVPNEYLYNFLSDDLRAQLDATLDSLSDIHAKLNLTDEQVSDAMQELTYAEHAAAKAKFEEECG